MRNLLSSVAVQVSQCSHSQSSAEELSAHCLSALNLLHPLPVWASGLHGAMSTHRISVVIKVEQKDDLLLPP